MGQLIFENLLSVYKIINGFYYYLIIWDLKLQIYTVVKRNLAEVFVNNFIKSFTGRRDCITHQKERKHLEIWSA